MYQIGDNIPYQQGWVCPKCGRVYSPSQSMCMYCSDNNTTVTNIPNTTGVTQVPIKDIITNTCTGTEDWCKTTLKDLEIVKKNLTNFLDKEKDE